MSESRVVLIALTNQVKKMQALGTLPKGTVNEGLTALYAVQGKTGLKTMTAWSEEGMKIKKGSKALWVWAKPRTVQDHTTQAEVAPMEGNAGDEQRYRFFPMAKLFSAEDVEPMSEQMRGWANQRLQRFGKRVRSLELEPAQ